MQAGAAPPTRPGWRVGALTFCVWTNAVILSTHPRSRPAPLPAHHPQACHHTLASHGHGPTLSEGNRRCGRQQARDSRRMCTLAIPRRRSPTIRLQITLTERASAAGALPPALSCWCTIFSLCDRRMRPVLATSLHTTATTPAYASRYSPHTQELHGHALNTGAMYHPPGGSAACLAGPYSNVNSMLGQLHAERVAAGGRPHTHDHIATSPTPAPNPLASPCPAP